MEQERVLLEKLPPGILQLLKDAEDELYPFLPPNDATALFMQPIALEEDSQGGATASGTPRIETRAVFEVLLDFVEKYIQSKTYKKAAAVLFVLDRFMYYKGRSEDLLKYIPRLEKESPETAIAPQLVIRRSRVMKDNGDLHGALGVLDDVLDPSSAKDAWKYKTHDQYNNVRSVCVQIKGLILHNLGLWVEALEMVVDSIQGFQSLPVKDEKGTSSSYFILSNILRNITMKEFADLSEKITFQESHPLVEAYCASKRAGWMARQTPLFFTRHLRCAGEVLLMFAAQYQRADLFHQVLVDLKLSLQGHRTLVALESREEMVEFISALYNVVLTLCFIHTEESNKLAACLEEISISLYAYYCSSLSGRLVLNEDIRELIDRVMDFLELPRLRERNVDEAAQNELVKSEYHYKYPTKKQDKSDSRVSHHISEADLGFQEMVSNETNADDEVPENTTKNPELRQLPIENVRPEPEENEESQSTESGYHGGQSTDESIASKGDNIKSESESSFEIGRLSLNSDDDISVVIADPMATTATTAATHFFESEAGGPNVKQRWQRYVGLTIGPTQRLFVQPMFTQGQIQANQLVDQNAIAAIPHGIEKVSFSHSRVHRARVLKYNPQQASWTAQNSLVHIGEPVKVQKKGGMRDVYHVEYLNQDEMLGKYVGKVFRKSSRSVVHYEQDVMSQMTARFYVTLFNHKLKNIKKSANKRANHFQIQYLPVVHLQLLDSMGQVTGCMNVEPYFEGDFSRLTNNLSFRNAELDQSLNGIATAFSHFTYDESQGKLMVTDLQGWLPKNDEGIVILTDPQINSVVYKYFGSANQGSRGYEMFWKNVHEHCNDTCKMLGLKRPTCI